MSYVKKQFKKTIPDAVELGDGSLFKLVAVPEEYSQMAAASAEKRFKASEQYVERPFYMSHEPEDEDDMAERVLWTERDIMALDDDDPEKAEALEWWNRYKASEQQMELAAEDAILHVVYIEGVLEHIRANGSVVDLRIDEDDPDSFALPKGWVRKQERMGIDVPDDPYEAKFAYVTSQVRAVLVVKDIVSTCSLLSLQGIVNEEVMDRFDAVFQRELEGFQESISQNFAKFTEETGGNESDDSGRDLDLQPRDDGATGDEIVGYSPGLLDNDLRRESPEDDSTIHNGARHESVGQLPGTISPIKD